MRRIFFTILSCAVFAASGQTPNGLILKKGMVIESEIASYKTPLLINAEKWIKMKPGKRDEEVLKFNEDAAAGKISPAGNLILPTIINDESVSGNNALFTGTTKIGLTEYKLKIEITGDTAKYIVNDAKNFPIVAKNDTTGLWCFGIRKYPLKPETGTYIPGYINEMDIFPYDLTTTRRTFFQVDGGDGYGYYGFVNVRKKHKMSVSSITVNTPYYVAGKEDIQIAGRTFTAYKLLNAQWMKSITNDVVTEDPTRYFDNEQLSNSIKENLKSRGRGLDGKEGVDRLLKNASEKAGMAPNEYGYLENYQESWYVPELCMIVKSKFYDAYGALQMESKVVAIK